MSNRLLQSVLWLRVRSGSLDDLVEEYRRVGVIEAAVPFGLLRGEAITLVGDDRTLLVTSVWREPHCYDDWLASDERVRVTQGVTPLLEPDGQRIERATIDAAAASAPIPVRSLLPAGTAVDRRITVSA